MNKTLGGRINFIAARVMQQSENFGSASFKVKPAMPGCVAPSSQPDGKPLDADLRRHDAKAIEPRSKHEQAISAHVQLLFVNPGNNIRFSIESRPRFGR